MERRIPIRRHVKTQRSDRAFVAPSPRWRLSATYTNMAIIVELTLHRGEGATEPGHVPSCIDGGGGLESAFP
ncbi:MAG: hypothetical protein HDR79_04955 [Bacteroides sp.]|nr:hypothetical protein [Bacteroides sp.]